MHSYDKGSKNFIKNITLNFTKMEMLKTEKQALRESRNKDIADRYRRMRIAYPTVSQARIFAEIAKDYDVGAPQIRLVCKSMGVC